MNKTKWIKLFRKLHKWPSIVIAFFAILFAVSGIVLNHRDFFSGFDLSRRLMPPGYQYKNWNLAAVRSSLTLSADSVLIYGNIGIWLSDSTFSGFTDVNQGFPRGIDKRKVYALARFNGQLVAGTHFGLYRTGRDNFSWQKLQLPVGEERIADLALKDDTLLVLTRSFLLKTRDLLRFEVVTLPPPEGYQRKTGLFNTLWELHSGELFGLAGRLFVDLLGLTVILLCVTGLLHFFFPKWIKRRKDRRQPPEKLVAAKRVNLRWHNVVGYLAVLFLVINTVAGMFLRPPLLIPVAGVQVGIIPFTHLDNPNPWYDKLRRVTWNEALGCYLFSTSEGFFQADEALDKPPQPTPSQPPVSVMGCNVLEPAGPVSYLVGSFSGLYVWNISRGTVVDFITGQPYRQPASLGRPTGDHMAAGFVVSPNGEAWWFDYNHGATALGSGEVFPEMERAVLQRTPISWWNAALEVHTGRIFEHLVGAFYILYVPLAGICLLMVLISGFFVWWMAYRKKKKSAAPR